MGHPHGSPPDDGQEEIIRRYCAEAESALERAGDGTSARAIVDRYCSRFQAECASELVVHATRRYLEQRIRQRWPAGTP